MFSAASRNRLHHFVNAALWIVLLSIGGWHGDLQAQTAKRILVMGDSLSAAYGLRSDQGWVALLGEHLNSKAGVREWEVVNASISGETSAGGLARIEHALATHQPVIVVLELGANDGLRGLPLELTEQNLARMIERSHAVQAKVLLIGMRIPPNYGPDYTQAFEALFSRLANAHQTAFLPFLMEPIATQRGSFQDDNLHPTAAAQPALMSHVLAALEPLLMP